MPREAKERFCFNCGASMGVYADYDRMDDCGAPSHDRDVNAARNILALARSAPRPAEEIRRIAS